MTEHIGQLRFKPYYTTDSREVSSVNAQIKLSEEALRQELSGISWRIL